MRVAGWLVLLALAGSVPAQDGASLLIIACDEYVPAVKPLADWHHAAGMPTRLVPTSVTGTTLEAIGAYIDSAFYHWMPRPAYVLLVGHPSVLPAARYGQSWVYYSDNDYGDVEGDVRAEIAVGRFPVRSAAQCDVMVAKALAYQRTPELSDTLWMRRFMGVISEDMDPNDSIYWNDIRTAAMLARGVGFVACESLSTLRGDDSADVNASVDAGTGLVLFRGSAVGNWYWPFVMHPERLANGNRLPVVLSVTCATMTLDPYDSMVGSAWVLAGTGSALKGAVAFFGNTHSDMYVARQRSAVARGFVTGLFAEGRYRLGDAMLRAKAQLLQLFPSATDDYRGFSIFGDPALPVWTATPKLLSVSHPDSIPLGPAIVEVIVLSGGTPVTGAFVCASMDSAVYVVDTTDAEGRARLDLVTPDTGTMRLVVTGRNLNPCEGTVTVFLGSGSQEPAVPTAGRAPALTAAPSTFRDATVVTIACAPDRARVLVCDAGGRVVRELPALAGAATWDGRDRAGVRVRSGTYFLLLTGDRVLARARVTRLD